jgi:hypothetical protein
VICVLIVGLIEIFRVLGKIEDCQHEITDDLYAPHSEDTTGQTPYKRVNGSKQSEVTPSFKDEA